VWGRTHRGPKAPPYASTAPSEAANGPGTGRAWGPANAARSAGEEGRPSAGTMGYDGPVGLSVAVDDVSVSGEGTAR
jgi:hypothetical protein